MWCNYIVEPSQFSLQKGEVVAGLNSPPQQMLLLPIILPTVQSQEKCNWIQNYLPTLPKDPPFPRNRSHSLTSLSGLEPMLSIAIGLLGVLLLAEEGMTWLGLTPGETEGGGLGDGALSSGANLFP